MAFVPYVTNPWPMPSVEKVPDSAVQAMANDSGILAIISSRPDWLAVWNARLEGLGLAYREVSRHRVSLPASAVTVVALEIVQKAPPGVTFSKPVYAVTAQTTPQVNIYGSREGKLIERTGMRVFNPDNVSDHISYPFVDVPPPAAGLWAQLTVEFPPAASNEPSCKLSVQDRSFTSLASIPCESRTRVIKLPPKISALRVYLTDPRERSFVLPQRIEIALSAAD